MAEEKPAQEQPGGAKVPGVLAVRVRIDTTDLPRMTYTNHIVSHFTGGEVVLYGTVVEHPLPSGSSGPPPEEMHARVQARWVMSPDSYLDHIVRSVRWIEKQPALREIYEELMKRRQEEG
ncbi:MAG: hypothetical protein HY690_08870 [Chloroflexi bacterium]|nr:hypothetical protein [Chloroflexota bacterium]